MIDASLLTIGAQAPDIALTLNRVALGLFFMISGYHKLFTASRHATLRGTLQEAGVPALPVMQWLVPGVELGAGVALILAIVMLAGPGPWSVDAAIATQLNLNNS